MINDRKHNSSEKTLRGLQRKWGPSSLPGPQRSCQLGVGPPHSGQGVQDGAPIEELMKFYLRATVPDSSRLPPPSSVLSTGSLLPPGYKWKVLSTGSRLRVWGELKLPVRVWQCQGKAFFPSGVWRATPLPLTPKKGWLTWPPRLSALMM